MAKKFVLYTLAVMNLAFSYFTAIAVANLETGSVYYGDSLLVLASFIVGIALFVFIPIWIAAALVLYAHDSL
jgi:hypothetical protein